MASSAHLTNRDLAILLMAWNYAGVTVEHIRHRFFPTPGARTPCYRRVNFLVEHEFLASQRLPAQSGIGSGKAFLTLGPQGRPIVAELLGLSRTEIGRGTRAAAPLVIHHHLAVCDTRLSFELSCEQSDIFNLEEWLGDGEVMLRVKDPKTRKDAPVIPDSTFTLALPDDSHQQFYVEQDNSTIPVKRIKTKIRCYFALHEAGDTNPILFVVLDERRRDYIAKWAVEEAEEVRGADPTIIWTALKGELTQQTVLTKPIWRIVGGPAAVSLTDLVVGNTAGDTAEPEPGYSTGYPAAASDRGLLS